MVPSVSSTHFLFFFLYATLVILPYDGVAARKLSALVTEPVVAMEYHKGSVLTGQVSVNLIFYGKFSPSQRAILSDFISSISDHGQPHKKQQPTVASWWKTLDSYYAISKSQIPNITLSSQLHDEFCSLGKSLKLVDIARLAARAAAKSTRSTESSFSVVLTADDVAVEEFCESRCAAHWSAPIPARKTSGGSRYPYVWVGNSEEQCPGQCAWPFHQPIYGPQTQPLLPPNGDVGVDGMVVNLAAMLAGAATNPFGDGFYQGPADAPLEAASACSGIYGLGAYPGYPGQLLIDPTTGASYNAVGGEGGREYLVPSLMNPSTSTCSTLS